MVPNDGTQQSEQIIKGGEAEALSSASRVTLLKGAPNDNKPKAWKIGD